MDAIVVGIDVSNDRLDVALRPSERHFSVKRDAAGRRELTERLTSLGPSVVALEATGGYGTVVAASLAGAALAVVVVNPAQVRAFARALGKRAKTDPLDAGVIAHFAEATKPSVRPLPDADTRRLADLVARRGQIIDMPDHRHDRRRAATPEAPDRETATEKHRPPACRPAKGTLGVGDGHRRCGARLAGVA